MVHEDRHNGIKAGTIKSRWNGRVKIPGAYDMIQQLNPTHRAVWFVCLGVLAGTLLAGCQSEPREPGPPPIFRVDEVWYWFEGDILVVNVTITNQANFTPGIDTLYPEMAVYVSDWLAKEKPSKEPGEDLYVEPGKGRQGTGLTLDAFSYGPWHRRWYGQEARDRLGLPHQSPVYGPTKIHPGESLRPEFGFVPDHDLSGQEGYYAIDFHLDAFYPRGWEEYNYGGIRLQFGCFNRDVDEFYGVKSGGPDCQHYDMTGRPTGPGVAIFGEEHAALPTMKRGPPPGHW